MKPKFALLLALTAVPPCFTQTGIAVPELAIFERLMPEMLARWHIQGASLAIAKDGRLVFARGYGLADVEAAAPVEPESLFRISSVSKTLTAAGVMKLVEENRLDLDACAFCLLDNLTPPWGATPDPRLYQITIRQLLHHTAGFDKEKGGPDANDPLRPPMSEIAATVLGAPRPASGETIIRWMMGRPLDFDPGTRYVYSSFGYCVLARIIERITGERYEDYIQRTILHPAGIGRTRLGRARLSERAPGEVRYYNYPSMPVYTSVYGDGQVLFAYGAYGMEAIDASGGWISSAVDLVRFGVALDGLHEALLAPETMRQVFTPPDPPADSNYGLGWFFATTSDGTRWWHFGGTPYTASSYLARLPNGICLAVLFNGTAKGAFWSEIESLATSTAAGIAEWPTHDLFSRYYAADAPAIAGDGVRNAASQAPGPVAAGEIVTLTGERLGPALVTAGDSSGTRVFFDDVPAPVLFASATYVTAQVPQSVVGQPSATIRLEYQDVSSAPVAVQVAAAAPGLFPFVFNADGWLNSDSRPAAPGECLTFWGTGEGGSPVQSEVTVAGLTAEVLSEAAWGGFFQLTVRVPPDIAPSNAAPVVARFRGIESPPLPVAVR